MLRHIVMYKLLPEAGGRTKAENLAIAAELGKAVAAISELRGFQCGVVQEGTAETNYDIALVCDLDDTAALAEYKKHPAHKAFGAHCHAVCESRAAIDYII